MSSLSFLQDTAAELCYKQRSSTVCLIWLWLQNCLVLEAQTTAHLCWNRSHWHLLTNPELWKDASFSYLQFLLLCDRSALGLYGLCTANSSSASLWSKLFCKPCCCIPATENRVPSLLNSKAHLRRTTRVRLGGINRLRNNNNRY